MKSPNWIRIALCGFVSGVVWYLLAQVVLASFAPDFVSSVRGAAPYQAQGGAFFFAIDLLMGVWAVWLYSAIAPRYGTRLTTMIIVAVAWWICAWLYSKVGFVDDNQ